ncbi:MAG: hypothetical protein NT010_12415 [Proteobacteria bacterium]|nr:hypothetical protein [Pseudomonadota bacterium]
MGRNRRICWIIGIVFFSMLIITGHATVAQDVPGKSLPRPKPLLQNIEAQQHDDNVSIVLTFKGNPEVEKPVITKDRIKLYCRDTETRLAHYQPFKSFKSWVRLKKADNKLNIELAIPPDLPVVQYSPPDDSGKLIVTFRKTSQEPSSPERKEVATATDLLSLNFYESDIRQVLLGIAMSRSLNVVMSTEVVGKVTVNLDKVSLDEAISSIALAGGFSCRQEKGVYFIFKPKDKPDSQTDRLQVRVFKLNFARTDKVQEILSAIPGIRIVRIHEDTKTIVVEDTPENIAKIETIINAWDESPKQVLIEATILEVQLTDDMKLGVDWKAVMGTVTLNTGTNFSGPAAKGIAGVVTSGVGSLHEFTSAINALQSITKVNTLSTPKILAVHGKPARVQVGGKQGYKTTVTNLGVTTEQIQFLDTGTILDITAYIGDENNILLSVQPQSNSVAIDAVTQIPTVSTTTVSTTLLAKSNQTVFIGGLIQDSVTNTRTMIPFLGKIPVLGHLFGYTNPNIQKKELVVLITPRLMENEINRATDEAEQKIEGVDNQYRKKPPSAYREFFKN